MTTLTLEWDTVVRERHRIVLVPEQDGVPAPFESLEQLTAAARVYAGEEFPGAALVPAALVNAVPELLEHLEALPRVGEPPKPHTDVTEDVMDRSLAFVHKTPQMNEPQPLPTPIPAKPARKKRPTAAQARAAAAANAEADRG